MTKIVINKKYNTFYLNEKVFFLYTEKGGKKYYGHEIKRDCPILIEAVKELGK